MSAADAAAPGGTPGRGGPGLAPAGALAWRAFRDARVRTAVFAYVFALYSFVQPYGYRHAYPTPAARIAFARSFGINTGLQLFYGEAHDLLTVGGYTAWRVGGTLAIAAAIFGVLAAVRALRTEEEAGRTELVLAGALTRRTAFLSALAAIGAGTLVLWLAELVGFAAGRLPVGGSAYLALATVSVVPVFAGVGALASQLSSTRRGALGLGGAAVALALLLRAVADTSNGLGWLRWTSPLGWAEELRPFTGVRPLVLLLPAATTVLLLALAIRIAARRDVGTGLLPEHESAAPRLALLSSPAAQALRSERGTLLAWAGGVALFAFVLGVVSESVSSAGISTSLQKQIAKLGSGSIATPRGYLAFVFFVFVLSISVFVCTQVGSARQEEAEQRLETLLSLTVGRSSWLGGRLLLAGATAAGLSILAGLVAWAGAASAGVDVSPGQMLEAGVNCVPAALLFLGIAALAYAAVPRASAAIAYALVAVAFLWQTVGALVGAPQWLVELTPFAHIGLVPTQAFRAGAAAIFVGIGLLAALAALGLFRRRDLLVE